METNTSPEVPKVEKSKRNGIVLGSMAIIIIVGSVLVLNAGYKKSLQHETEKLKSTTASLVTSQVPTLIDPAIFTSTDTDLQTKNLERYWHSVQSPNLVRIKVYDLQSTVIYSNLPEIIGQKFTDNSELQDALKGEVEVELAKNKSEHVTEQQYTELSETYVPVRNAGGQVVGIVELYQTTIELRQAVMQEWLKQLFIVALVVIIGFGLLAYIFHRTLKTRPIG